MFEVINLDHEEGYRIHDPLFFAVMDERQNFVCECSNRSDADMICEALNKTR